LLEEIVSDGFRKGLEFKVTNVQKSVDAEYVEYAEYAEYA